MRRFRTLLPLVLLAFAADTHAQVPAAVQVVQADGTAFAGWFNAREDVSDGDDDWYSRSMFGGAAFGWYWTDNVKTEFEAGFSSQAQQYGFFTEIIDGQPIFVPTRSRFSTRRLSVNQQYQFFRNVWFHPFLAAGLDVRWKTSQREDEVAYLYRPGEGVPRRVRERRVLPEQTDVEIQPVVLTGFKAYLTRQAFFRADLRLGFRGRIDEAVLRLGFGVDLPARRMP